MWQASAAEIISNSRSRTVPISKDSTTGLWGMTALSAASSNYQQQKILLAVAAEAGLYPAAETAAVDYVA